MLSASESCVASSLSSLFLDAIEGLVPEKGNSNAHTYVVMVLNYSEQTATPHKVNISFDNLARTIEIEDTGKMGSTVKTTTECLQQTYAAYFELRDHTEYLGWKIDYIRRS